GFDTGTSEVEAIEHVTQATEGVPDTLADPADRVTDALTDPADGLAEAVEPAGEEHAHEHPLHRPEATVVTRGVGLVSPATLPVRDTLGADHHLADVRLGASSDPLHVEC